MFRPVKDSSEYAVSAANAYQTIIDGLKNASKAAEQSQTSADDAYKVAYPDDGTKSLVNAAKQSKEKSNALSEESIALKVNGVTHL
jgi:hypothetical protein